MNTAAALAPVILRPWPRLLDAPLAAEYLGISASKFAAGVKAEPPRYPPPIRDGGNVLWDIRALDAHVDALAGLAPPSPPATQARNSWDAS
jgi:hypothetical protein